MKRYIASISDTQLYKRLYGINELRNDWYDAFSKASDYILEYKNQIDLILLPGDILDLEEVGSSAIYNLFYNLKKLDINIPIIALLGNHDQPHESSITWIDSMKLINPNIIEPSLTEPYLCKNTDSTKKDIRFWGSHHQQKKDIIESLSNIDTNLTKTNTEDWLILHQSLKELAPHPDAYEVSCKDVPSFIDHVILGDFHDHEIYIDNNRHFIYTGSTETVSFNQTVEPGMILINRDNVSDIKHLPTKQRDYININLKTIPEDKWGLIIPNLLKNSFIKYNKLPVVRVLCPEDKDESWFKFKPSVENLAIRIETKTICDQAITDNIPIQSEIPSDRSEVLDVAVNTLDKMDVKHKKDAISLLKKQSSLEVIQKNKFPEVSYKKSC